VQPGGTERWLRPSDEFARPRGSTSTLVFEDQPDGSLPDLLRVPALS